MPPPFRLLPLPWCVPWCEQVMEGANVEVDEAAEERKGGAGDLGKVRRAGARPAASAASPACCACRQFACERHTVCK